MVTVDDGPVGSSGATSSGAAPLVGNVPRLPNLDELDGRIRWWSDLIGLTDALDDEPGQQLLSPNVSQSIVANLQCQSSEERAGNVAALLSFVGLFIGELMRAVYQAEHGEQVSLLQLGADFLDYEQTNLMQSSVKTGPGNFAAKLVELQAALDAWSKPRRLEWRAYFFESLTSMRASEGVECAARTAEQGPKHCW